MSASNVGTLRGHWSQEERGLSELALRAVLLQTPTKGSRDFQRMLEEAMNRDDAAAFAGLLWRTYTLIAIQAL
jgi:hypothetical protein